MKALHLAMDGNFISTAIKNFDKYTQGDNYYVIFQVDNANLNVHKIEDKSERIFRYCTTDKAVVDDLVNLCMEKGLQHLVLHGMSLVYVRILQVLKPLMTGKVYWIFWGYELYTSLGEQNKFKVVDNTSIFNRESWIEPTPQNAFIRNLLGKKPYYKKFLRMLPYVDYFCFWMESDFELLKRHYPTHAQFKYFQYSAPYRDTYTPMYYGKAKRSRTIIVGHQASSTGNHITVFKKLKNLEGIENFQISVPVSYGRGNIKKIILSKGSKMFGHQFQPILDYMTKEDYFELICSNEVAIFGQLRQEASGNVTTMIKNGVKIFLRNDNPMYKYLKDAGYLVSSFEDDLNTVDDLKPLSAEERLHNRAVGDSLRKYCEDFMPAFFDD